VVAVVLTAEQVMAEQIGKVEQRAVSVVSSIQGQREAARVAKGASTLGPGMSWGRAAEPQTTPNRLGSH
jgi:hypothetical protein